MYLDYLNSRTPKLCSPFVSISCENGVDGESFKVTKVVTVLEKRTLTVGPLKLYNLELEVCYANITAIICVIFTSRISQS